MGVRVYLPGLGRFLQVDPIEGGNDNNYAYVGDPVNGFSMSMRQYTLSCTRSPHDFSHLNIDELHL